MLRQIMLFAASVITLAVPMAARRLHRELLSLLFSGIAIACCLLGLMSCDRSPTAPSGQIRVSITQDGLRPAPGKRIELVGTPQRATTDKMGLALFLVPAGHYVVRAYDIATPGPGLAFVDRNADVQAGLTTQVEYFDCTMCRAPQP